MNAITLPRPHSIATSMQQTRSLAFALAAAVALGHAGATGEVIAHFLKEAAALMAITTDVEPKLVELSPKFCG
jgi:hypothetical protein